MGWTWRKSKSFGPLRLTLTKSGISASLGAGPVRFTRAADGSVWRTVRIPGTGIYNRQRIQPPPPNQGA